MADVSDQLFTLDDLREIEAESNAAHPSVEQIPLARPEVSPEDAAPKFGEDKGAYWRFIRFGEVVGKQDFVSSGLARFFAGAGMEFDPNFDLGRDVPKAEFDELTAGMDDDTIERLGSAKSKAHLYFLADLARESMGREDELASYGGWGIAGRVAANLADPASVALAVGTGGIGVAPKATRLAQAVRAAAAAEGTAAGRTALAALETAAKASGNGRVLKLALIGAAENAALEGAIVAGDPTRDAWDVAYAGLGGLVLGGGVAKLLTRGEQRALRSAYQTERRLMSLAELDETLKARRGDLLKKLDGDPAMVRAAIQQLDDEVATLAATRADLVPDKINRPAVEARLQTLEPVPARTPSAAEVAPPGAAEAVAKGKTTPASAVAPDGLTAVAAKAPPPAEVAQLRAALGLADRAAELAPKRALLRDLDTVDATRTAADEAATAVAAGKPDIRFTEDTLSAARSIGVVDDIHEILKPISDSMPVQGRMQFAAATKLIGGTFSGVLRGAKSERIRSTLGRLVGNSVGNEDGSAVAVGASEIAGRLAETKAAKFNSVATPAYREWAERRGYGILDRQTRQVRDEFMQEVGRFTRGELIEDVDPAVRKMAAKQSELYAEFLREAKEAGVKGFENVEINKMYLPRVFDFEQLAWLEQQFGTEGINQLVAGAIRAADDEIAPDLAAKLGAAYVKKLRQMRVGSDAHVLQGVRWDDVGFLRQFLGDAGTAPDEIESVVNEFAALNARRARQQEGNFRYAKRRTTLDETFSLKLPRIENGVRVWEEVRVSQLFENNAESLFQRYTRSVSGHIGLAKVGIKSRADFDAMIREAENELASDPKELKKVVDSANMAYRIVTGQPVEDANAFTQLARTARDWNFATTMNQAGFAQIPDLAGLLSKGYLRHTFDNFGWAFKAMKRTDGTLDDEFARELEEWVGLGTDYHNNAVFSAFDHTANRFERTMGAVGHTARVLGRGTQALSGMAFITAMTQRMAGRAIVQRLVKETLEGGAFSARRAADLGLDPALSERIGGQIRKHTAFVDNEAGGKVRLVNWEAWDDVEARDAMLNSVFREARRLVQEEDLGDTSAWMHSTFGKLIAQFRRFALVSYSKQMLHGIAHRDAETATRMMVSMALAAMAYRARWELRLAQTPNTEERDRLRQQYLSWEGQAAAAFAQSSYASLLPAVIDSAAAYGADTRLFDTRTSGQASDLLNGVPTYALAKNAASVFLGIRQAATRDDRQFTQSDARALRKLLPFQNLIGMDYVFNAITVDLPEKDEDDDPNATDWSF